jgi:hypothetical protein
MGRAYQSRQIGLDRRAQVLVSGRAAVEDGDVVLERHAAMRCPEATPRDAVAVATGALNASIE